jgi:hypothetical protein
MLGLGLRDLEGMELGLMDRLEVELVGGQEKV